MKSKKLKPLIGTLFTLTFCTMTFASFQGTAQDISQQTLSWRTDQVLDLQTNASISMKCTFKTIGASKVEWIQKNGSLKTIYNVTSIQGSWPNISQTGSVTYVLERNGKSFKMLMEKSGPNVSVTLDFSKPGEFTSVRRFRVISVE
jgi:hypothetical protein